MLKSDITKNPEIDCKHRLHIIAKTLPFAINKVFKLSPFLFICLLLTTILTGLVPTAMLYVGKFLIDAITNVLKSGASSEEIRSLGWVLAIQLIVLVSGAIIGQTYSYLSYLIGRRLSVDTNAEIIKGVYRLDYAYFEQPKFYDMMARAKRESGAKPLTLVLRVSSMFRSIIVFISIGGIIASFSPALLMAIFVFSLPLLLVRWKYGEKNYLLQYSRTEDARMAGYMADIMMTRRYIPEILSFGLRQHLFEKWYVAARKFLRQDIQLRKRRTILETIIWSVSTCSTVAVTGYIIYINFAHGLSLTIGEIMMYSGAFTKALSASREIFEDISGFYENALFLNNLIEFNKIKADVKTVQLAKPVPGIVESIKLDNVSFKYPGSQKYVLKNLNVEFERSKSTLIIGANGAGKTTLIKLLIRLYEPTQGRILLNGEDIKEFEIGAVRRIMGTIFQEFNKYAFSAKENIACGKIDDLGNTTRIIASARRAKAHLFLEQLPEKYDTMLSKLFANGQDLSFGQWQRICLARLFMKDAPVFIFDEPTASLDIETEAYLLQEIVELSKDKICILISHRMFRKDICDQIVVLSKGKIAESGDYGSLVAKNGEFTRLWKLYHNVTEKEFSINHYSTSSTV